MDSMKRKVIEALGYTIVSDSPNGRLILVPSDQVKQLDPDVEAEIVRQLREGHIIAAIKIYKVETKANLADSKSAVELMALQRGLLHITLTNRHIWLTA